MSKCQIITLMAINDGVLLTLILIDFIHVAEWLETDSGSFEELEYAM